MTRARILLVEDENIVALEIEDLLLGLGHQVCGKASSGAEAIRQAAETRPDLALMDIRLKGDMDGIEAAGQISRRFEIPVIYLTAYTDNATVQRAKITEPFGYLIKPFEERELQTAIEMALYKHQMERRLKESERWLATTLRSIGDAVIATDQAGLITFMNPVAEALAGLTQKDALGKSSSDLLRILDEETRLPIPCAVTRVLRDGIMIGPGHRVMLRAGDSVEVPIDYSASPLKDDIGNVVGVVLVLHDVTEQRRAEAEIARRLAQTQTLREVMLAAACTLDFDQVLVETCSILRDRMQLEFLSFVIPDSEGGMRPHPAQVGYGKPLERVQIPLDSSVCGRVYRRLEPAIIGDVREEPHYFEIEPEVRSELAVPVHSRGRVTGVLNLESRRLHAFTEEDLVFYTAIAGQLGIALENACLYQEVSEQADDLRVAVARLQGLDSMKTQFMQNTSHELRTPLALILGYTECLVEDESESMSSCTRGMLGVVQEQAKKLSELVEDMALTWQNETQPVELEPVALHDVVRSSVLRFHRAAEEKGLNLESNIGKGVPLVQGTPECLRRVVDNLLSNAIKFTPSGGRVEVRLLAKADGPVLQVFDAGIGIAPEQHERIFDRFYQVDGSRTRRYEGMGLGLALVKEMVEACDGTVSVESELGKGSTFTVRLPIWSEKAHDEETFTATPHAVEFARPVTPYKVPRTVPQVA